jgi:hypothetical protein
MDTFKKYWGFLAMILGGIIGAYGWIYNQGATSQSLDGRVFDSPEQKVEVVQHVEYSPTPKQAQAKYLRDSMNTVHARKSRAMRDSIYIVETKARQRTDSIILLNADQMYQIKEEIKTLKEN